MREVEGCQGGVAHRGGAMCLCVATPKMENDPAVYDRTLSLFFTSSCRQYLKPQAAQWDYKMAKVDYTKLLSDNSEQDSVVGGFKRRGRKTPLG